MKKHISLLVLILLVSALFSCKSAKKTSLYFATDYKLTLKQDLFSLMLAYPEHLVDIEVTQHNEVYLILKSGKKLLYDDLKEKNETEILQNPDLQDMMSEIYILGPSNALMPEDYNPGRIRVYPLLKEVYGGNQHEIEGNLTGIKINANYHRFNSNNAAAHHLKKALNELNDLMKEHPNLWNYVHPIGGTYNFRYISGTSRLSPHAFGISIDLAIHKDDYWKWTSREAGEKRIKGYPREIVEVMEANYFIWGGKWGYFDTLHFEYRPEIIIKGMYFSHQPKDLWYEGLPVKNELVNNIVLLIEERLKDFSL